MKLSREIWFGPLIMVFMLFVRCERETDRVSPAINFNPSVTYGSITDQDGNTYKTVTIGTQVWMAENLRTTKYRNGDPIPNVSIDTQWDNLISGAFCNYKNDLNYSNTFGFLYNWYAVNDGRNIAPEGWHVASRDEWETLIENVTLGATLKETGTNHWHPPNSWTKNESGFTAIPAGVRYMGFHQMGDGGHWWSTQEFTDLGFNDAWSFILGNDYKEHAFQHDYKTWGKAIRCIKD